MEGEMSVSRKVPFINYCLTTELRTNISSFSLKIVIESLDVCRSNAKGNNVLQA